MGNQLSNGLHVDEVQGTAPKTPAHHPGPQHVRMVLGKIYQEINFRTTYLILVPQASMRLIE